MLAVHEDPLRSAATAARRLALGTSLGSRALLVCAGRAPARNYPANRHPFRASSHFLHLVGAAIEGAVLLLEGEHATLFLEPADPEDALWHGESASRESIERALGLRIESTDALRAACDRSAPLALASFDPAIRAQVEELGIRPPVGADADALIDALVGSRLHHDAHAARELRRAARITTRAHLAGMAVTRPGIPASVPRAAMEAVMTAFDAVPAYGSIVTHRGDVLHAGPSSTILAHEDLLLCDVGAETESGYAADVTRTTPVGGRFEAEARAVYEIVLDAQRRALDAVTVGARYRDVHRVAMQAIAEGLVAIGVLRGDPAERAFDGSTALFFPHGVGHLLGLDVHDLEDLGDRAGYAEGRSRSTEPGLRYLRLDRDLEPGMAFTIEPGIYFVPAILDPASTRSTYRDRVDFARVDSLRRVRGIRIEDDVLLHTASTEILTGSIPKSVADVEDAIGRGLDWEAIVERDPEVDPVDTAASIELGSAPDRRR